MTPSAHSHVEDYPSYGAAAKLLHHLALTFPVIGQTAFDLEKLCFRPGSMDDERHVFICGLARAGTTAVLMRLHESGSFRSLTYRDMPFVLAPNCWRTISRFFLQEKTLQQRAHGDGIKIGYDSPEAFEEVFWKTLYGSDFIKTDCLVPMGGRQDYSSTFKPFVSLVMKSADYGQRYLSKNNNNILRMGVISRIFPNGFFVLPFREPLQQAWSLRNQHNHFLKLHEDDPFAARYMSWLGHFEFGSDHRPGRFIRTEDSRYPVDTLAYWVAYWVETYSYVLNNLPERSILLNYELLCEESDLVWEALMQRLELSVPQNTVSFRNSYHQVDESLPKALLNNATELYKTLVSRSIGSSSV